MKYCFIFLLVFLVSVPVFAQQSENVTLVSWLGGAGNCEAVFVEGDYAYINSAHVVSIIDITNPAEPIRVGWVELSGGYGRDIYVLNDYAYVAYGGYGLRIIDVSDPENPFEAGFYDTPGYANGVHVLDGYVYLANGGMGLYILQFDPPTAVESE